MSLQTYEERTSGPLIGLALLFLVVYAVTVIGTGFPEWLLRAAGLLNGVIWITFGVDLAIRLALAPHRLAWIARHPIDVASVVLPALRPLRVLRVFTAGQTLLARRGGLLRTGQAILFSAAILVLVGALAELDAEQDAPGATIVSFGDALWWAMTTVTTVGYGDLTPVTVQGRIVAVALMLVGISVLGTVTASIAAWFVETTEQLRAAGSAAEPNDEPAGTADEPPPGGRQLSEADAQVLLRLLHHDGLLTDAELAAARRRAGQRR